MRRQLSFAEMLDAALASDDHATPLGQGLTTPAEPAHPFVYYRALRSLGTNLAAVRRQVMRPAASVSSETPPTSQRRLTVAQQDALDALNALGANLTVDFSAADLRRAYRRLARRCHPDAHYDAGPLERARLTRLFTTMQIAYRRLESSLQDQNSSSSTNGARSSAW